MSINYLANLCASCGLRGAAAEVSRVDAMEGIKKTELVPIGDLNTYISNSNEQVTLGLSFS